MKQGEPVSISATVVNVYDHNGEVMLKLTDGQGLLTNVRNIGLDVASDVDLTSKLALEKVCADSNLSGLTKATLTAIAHAKGIDPVPSEKAAIVEALENA